MYNLPIVNLPDVDLGICLPVWDYMIIIGIHMDSIYPMDIVPIWFYSVIMIILFPKKYIN